MVQRRAFVLACVVACAAAGAGRAAAESPEDAAQAAADSWLRLVDSGDYGEAWSGASAALKAAAPQADWSRAVGAARTPLGPLTSRRLKSRRPADKAAATRAIGGSLYTVASGRYVVVQYETAFANKPSATETAIAVADPDGAWRVAGYSVR